MTIIHIERAIPTETMPALSTTLVASYPTVAGLSARTNEDGSGYVDVIVEGYLTPSEENGVRQMVLTWDTSQRTPEQEAAAALAAKMATFESDLTAIKAGLSDAYAVHDCAVLVQSLCDMVDTLYKVVKPA